jgi:hypothetical protein
MILKVFSVADSAAGAFMQPFFSISQGAAIRSFVDAVNDANHEFHKHAADYTMFLLGEFDDANGSFSTQDPVKILTAFEVLIKDVTPTR